MARHPRRAFLKLSALGAASLVAPRSSGADDEAEEPRTFTFKTVGECAIRADVHGAGAAGAARPVVVWIHGGALIVGHRGGIDRALFARLREAGCVVVSIDYRLAPETKLPAIVEDVQDACRWVRERGPELFGCDPGRLAVMGGSAGGYLTLLTGHRVEPRPKALVSFWGYGDIAGAWYSRPDPFYRRMPLVPEDEARRVVGGAVLSESSGKNDRVRFYLYCRQNGLWPREVAGLDPDAEPRAFDPYCPLRNVTPDYPPTLLIHGTQDTDVPYEQSAAMDRELTRQGVEHELITVPGGGHGLGNVDRADVARIQARVADFVGRHLADG
jgi:acetyl esterase/lipase